MDGEQSRRQACRSTRKGGLTHRTMSREWALRFVPPKLRGAESAFAFEIIITTLSHY
jgi:hypothetical protein